MKQFTFKEIKERIEQWIETDAILPEDIPSIELYMDQVTTFMDEKLSGSTRFPGEDKVLTRAMINNYSKNELLPPPVRKKIAPKLLMFPANCMISVGLS